MFSTIITIIAIVLVLALALATLWFGGTSLNKASTSANIAKILQEGDQVAGALQLYKADNGGFPTGTSADIATALVSAAYLKQMPSGNWSFINDYAINTSLDHDSCLSLNQRLGLNAVPLCSDLTFSGQTFCCQSS